MSNNIFEAAVEFQRLMNYEYMLVFGYKGKSAEIPLRFDKYNFYHLCGLHKLVDIFDSNQNQGEVFQNIMRGIITDNYLSKSKHYIEKGVEDRINRVADLANLLNQKLCQSREAEVYKYNRNANPESTINGDFLIKCTAQDKRTVYLILREDSSNQGKYFGLSVFSRDLSDKKQRDFAAGHTPNTLLYVSKTPLTADKQLDKEKEIVIYQRPSYAAPNNSNIKIVKFTPITSVIGDTAALAVPRPSFGQALVNLINKWADRIQEGIENRRRELQSAKEEIAELKQALSERDEQLAQKDEQLNAKDDEIAVLHKQNTALTVEMYEQRKLIQAANPPKTLSQKLDEARKKCRERNVQNPHRRNPPNQNRHKR